MAKSTIKPSVNSVIQENVNEAVQRLKAVAEDMAEEQTKTESKKDNKIQTVNFNMSKSMYEELKKLYGGAGYSFAQGARMTFDYIISEILDGNLELRESGFRKTLSARVGR